MRRAPKWATSIARIAVDAKLLKMTFSIKAAGDESAGGVPSGIPCGCFQDENAAGSHFQQLSPTITCLCRRRLAPVDCREESY